VGKIKEDRDRRAEGSDAEWVGGGRVRLACCV
jgi:hypothetical protein